MRESLLFLFGIFAALLLSISGKGSLIDKQWHIITSPTNTNVYRGFAMLIIMIAHVCGNWGVKVFTPLGGVGVAIFLFLSGYGLSESHKKSGLKNFWQKKILRVVLPYTLFRIVCVMVDGVDDWMSFFLDIMCWESTYWYIDYMVRCYIVFWFAYKFCSKYKYVVFILFSLYTFFFMNALRAEQSLSFLIGIMSSSFLMNIKSWNKKTLVLILLAMSIWGISCLAIKQLPAIREFNDTYFYYLVEMGIKLPLAISMIIMLYLLPIRFRNSPIFIFFGIYSLELYLVHIRLIPIIVGDSFLQGIAMIIVSILIAYSFHTGINKLLEIYSKMKISIISYRYFF